jgi:hypothetical protein
MEVRMKLSKAMVLEAPGKEVTTNKKIPSKWSLLRHEKFSVTLEKGGMSVVRENQRNGVDRGNGNGIQEFSL